jgi:hypothetical protein
LEIAFEVFAAALEADRGVAEPIPTHYFPFVGTIQQAFDVYRHSMPDGTYENYVSERITRKWSTFEGSGALDTYNAPYLFNLIVKDLSSPSTPVGGTLSRLWDFAPVVNADVQASQTGWFGDPNVQVWRAPYEMVDTFTITADGTSTDVVTMDISGFGQRMTKVADPTLPTQLVGPLLPPLYMQCWMDTGDDDIGTTEVTGRLLSAILSAELTRSRKHIPAGPGGGLDFTRTGIGKRNATCALRFEVPDTNEWDLMDAGTPVKCRVRISGDLIEGALYQYVEWDIFGILAEPAWGDFETTNRTLDVTITSTKDATAGYSWALRVQNDRATL